MASVGGFALLGAASRFDRMSIANIDGRYEGDGIWHDSAGDSMKYRVVQTNRVTAGGLAISFTHNFADGSVVQAGIALNQIAPYIYSVRLGDGEVGRGYELGDMLRYHMRAGAGIVEVGYRPRGVDRLEVLGSSTTNAAGKYVAWHEKLRRTSP
jgi:hypothetical protein